MLGFLDKKAMFFDAATRGDVETLEELQQNGMSIDEQNSLGQTALHLAILNSQTNAIHFLMRAGASALIEDNNGITPSSLAFANIELRMFLLVAALDMAVKAETQKGDLIQSLFPTEIPSEFTPSHSSGPACSSNDGLADDSIIANLKRLRLEETKPDEINKKQRGSENHTYYL